MSHAESQVFLQKEYAFFSAAFRYSVGEGMMLCGSEYLEAFDVGVSEGATSIHESAYVDADTSSVFEELVRFYEHFGLRRSEDAELPDHLSVELEFMEFLVELEHRASLRGDDVKSVRRAQRDFLDRHVSVLIDGIISNLDESLEKARTLAEMCLEHLQVHRQTLAEDS